MAFNEAVVTVMLCSKGSLSAVVLWTVLSGVDFTIVGRVACVLSCVLRANMHALFGNVVV